MEVSHNSLINFANKDIGTQIHTAAITIDGCEVENLIDGQPATFNQSKCFMSEYYIKCPIEIVLTFPCLVHISAIVFEPKVLSHRSKCIELYTVFQKPVRRASTTHTVVNTKMDASKNKFISACISEYPCVYPKDITVPAVREANRPLLDFVGKYKDQLGSNTFPDAVVFANRRHEQIYNNQSSNSFETDLRTYASTRSCSHLIIKITWATIPVLKNLAVWGTLSSLNSQNVSKHVYDIISKQRHVTEFSMDTKAVAGTTVNHQISDEAVADIQTQNKFDINIPEEFIDPITYSIMAVPLLLPSGNTIDRDTLDKYIYEEEKYGRLPSDPFTAIVFHDSKQPVPNSSLKLRIDQFLLKNSNFLPTINGQTTGLQSGNSSKTVDMLLKTNERLPKRVLHSNIDVRSKKARTDCPDTTNDMEHNLLNSDEVNKKHSSETSNSHESNLKDSLDLSLYETLSMLPIRSNRVIVDSSCLKCFNTDEMILFRLPCTHLLCRACLQATLNADKKCISCNRFFGRKDVIKFNK